MCVVFYTVLGTISRVYGIFTSINFLVDYLSSVINESDFTLFGNSSTNFVQYGFSYLSLK